MTQSWECQHTGADHSTLSFTFAKNITLPLQPVAPPPYPCNLSWWTRFHNLSALSEGVTVWTFILHMWLHQAGIMCCAANIGVNDLCAGMRGAGNSHMYHVIIIITLRPCREMLLFPDPVRVQLRYESCIIASTGGLQTDAEDVVR